MLKKLNLKMAITKVLMLLENIRLLYRVQKNKSLIFYNTCKNEVLENIKIALPDDISDSLADLARLFHIDETYTKDNYYIH